MKGLCYQLIENILGAFKGRNVFFHIAAVILTAVIVLSGFDWWYFTHAHGSAASVYLWPAVALGGIIPIFTPLGFFIGGKLRKSVSLMNTGYALGQSAFLGLLLSSVYKAFTGRVPPMHHMLATAIDISHEFQFGFMRGGVFWGWPSSHTTVAFATMCTLMTLYPKRVGIRIAATCYALYVGFGVSMGIHWFSEFIAGMLIGSAIGISVGRSFLQRLNRGSAVA